MDILADPIEQEVNVDGATPQGALFVSVKNTGANIATFNGVSMPPGEAKSYSFVGKGYKALPYIVNGFVGFISFRFFFCCCCFFRFAFGFELVEKIVVIALVKLHDAFCFFGSYHCFKF